MNFHAFSAPDSSETSEESGVTDENLLESNRPKKRRGGASAFTKRLYVILWAHRPEGMSLQKIIDTIGSRWAETGAYRLYRERTTTGQRLEYMSSLFEMEAKAWYTNRRLQGMRQIGLAKKVNGLWIVGDRDRRPRIVDTIQKAGYVELDPEKELEKDRLQREWEKAKQHQARKLEDGRLKGRIGEERLIYEMLCKNPPRVVYPSISSKCRLRRGT